MKPPYFIGRSGTPPITMGTPEFLQFSRTHIVNVSQCCQELRDIISSENDRFKQDNTIMASIEVYGRHKQMNIITKRKMIKTN